MNHLEKNILDIIEKYYKRKYTGGIKVTKLLSGYNLVLDLGIPDKRNLQIAYDCDSEEDFLKFIKDEIISRQLCRVQYFRGIKTEKEDETRGINCKN